MASYCPESPVGASYEPVSPKCASNAYTPESPKLGGSQISPSGQIRPTLRKRRVVQPSKPVDLSTIGTDTLIGKILHGMKNPIPSIKPAPFVPIENWESYVSSLRNNHKRTIANMDKIPEGFIERCEAIIEKIVKDHTKYYAKYPPKEQVPPKKLDIPYTIDHVIVKLNVLKSGKVRIHMSAPMASIYEKYYSKGMKPPIGEHIRALKAFGYPDENLEKVLKNHENLPKKKAQMEEVFERVFGSTSTSKASKPKRKTVKEEIMKRLKNL
jgi:hypothetical protein